MFSAELRDHIEKVTGGPYGFGMQHAICEATGFLVSTSQLSMFINNGCNLSLKRVDALCEALNLELVRRPGQSPVEAQQEKSAADIAAYRARYGRGGGGDIRVG